MRVSAHETGFDPFPIVSFVLSVTVKIFRHQNHQISHLSGPSEDVRLDSLGNKNNVQRRSSRVML